MKNKSIYEVENQLKDGRMVEKSGKRIMYDIRKMSETVKKLGRPLANDEIKKYMV